MNMSLLSEIRIDCEPIHSIALSCLMPRVSRVSKAMRHNEHAMSKCDDSGTHLTNIDWAM